MIYSAQTLTCEATLFFQNTDNFRLCQRKLLLRHQTSILQRHGALWVYFFPERHQVTLRCPNSNNQMSRTISLLGTGLIHILSKCYTSSKKHRTLPESFGLLQAKLEIPNFYLPSNISAITDNETRQLEDIAAETAKIENNLTTRNTKANVWYGLTFLYASNFNATRSANTLACDPYHNHKHCHYPRNTLFLCILPYA